MLPLLLLTVGNTWRKHVTTRVISMPGNSGVVEPLNIASSEVFVTHKLSGHRRTICILHPEACSLLKL